MNESLLNLPSAEQVALWKAAEAAMAEKVEHVEKEFALSTLPDWHFDQGAGAVTFAKEGAEPSVRAEFVPAGSYSNESRTWVWAWANDDVEQKDEIGECYHYGVEKNMRELKEPQLDSTPEKAFQLASVASYILKEGVVVQLSNKVEGDTVGFIYLILRNIQRVR